ncbi:MAG: hypothetical protein GMKNLPBB_00298 [Myxococcota bacterium]|nr:hypothetical protein [Myxococcota bacterium]
MKLAQLAGQKRIIICAGSGGVGKTTLSAAVGAHFAAAGRKVLVVTIDPARRLANSLGLTHLSHSPTRIEPSLFGGGESFRGELWAMMLDMKSMWDTVIERYATPGNRDRILRNSFYQYLSTSLAGSQEYMALEKLFELRNDNRFDLIVLDTPPTSHALDFLNAPDRIINLLDHDAVHWLLKPYRAAGSTGKKMLTAANSVLINGLARFTGAEMLNALAEFLLAFERMYEGFVERSRRVKAILRGGDCMFLLVTSPEDNAREEALAFRDILQRQGMPFGAFVINRVVTAPGDPPPENALPGMIRESLPPGTSGPDPLSVSRELAALSQLQQSLARRHARRIRELSEKAGPGAPLFRVPVFDRDVCSAPDLRRFADVLFSLDS